MWMRGRVNRMVLAMVAARRLGMEDNLLGLAVRGRRSGTVYRFPVQYAVDDSGLVVVPGHADRKTWWRNLTEGPTEVEVMLDGSWHPATATVLRHGDRGRSAAVRTYGRRWPRVTVAHGQPVVRIGVRQHQARTPVGLSDRSRSTTAVRVP